MTEIDENVFSIKQGDLEPPLDIEVSGSKGDLNTVDSWRVIGSQSGTVVFVDNNPDFAIGATPQEGVVTHKWADGETDAEGPMDIEAKAIWPTGRIQTFPPARFSRVWIHATLG